MISRKTANLLAWLIISSGCSLTVMARDNPTDLKVNDMDNRLTRVERLLENEGLMSLLAKLDSLQKDVQELRNDVDTLKYEVGQASGRQRDLYLDLDQRLQNLEQGAARRASSGESGPAGMLLPVPGGTDQENYQAAFELLKAGEYEQASTALAQFLVAFPTSGLSDNAQYWLAETHYVAQQYPEALTAFGTVIERYPDSRKIPDALLKIGYCNYELGNWEASRSALTRVVQDFPETTPARLATQRLDRMKGEGH
jgi:tol-pal system protein YbgF